MEGLGRREMWEEERRGNREWREKKRWEGDGKSEMEGRGR